MNKPGPEPEKTIDNRQMHKQDAYRKRVFDWANNLTDLNWMLTNVILLTGFCFPFVSSCSQESFTSGEVMSETPHKSSQEVSFEDRERFLSKESRWTDLLRHYDRYLSQNRTSSASNRNEIYHKMATISEHKLGKQEEAFVILLKAFEENYTDVRTSNELERLAQSTGNWGKLLEICNSALRESQDPDVELRLKVLGGRWYAITGHPDYALSYFNRALQIDPDSPERAEDVLPEMAKIFRTSESWTATIQVLERMTDITTKAEKRVRFLYDIAEIYEVKLGDRTKALETYNRVLKVSPSHSTAKNAVNRLNRNQRKPK